MTEEIEFEDLRRAIETVLLPGMGENKQASARARATRDTNTLARTCTGEGLINVYEKGQREFDRRTLTLLGVNVILGARGIEDLSEQFQTRLTGLRRQAMDQRTLTNLQMGLRHLQSRDLHE